VLLTTALAVLAADGWWLVLTRDRTPLTPAALVREAVSQTTARASAKASFTTQVDGLTTMFGRVREQRRPHRATLTITTVDGADRFQVVELITDSAVYVNTPGLTESIGKKWLTVPLAGLGSDPAVAGLYQTAVIPSSAVALLRAADAVRKTWTAYVDGVLTTRFTGTIDPAVAAAKLSAGERRLLAPMLSATGDISFVVWIDGSHEIRKLRSTAVIAGEQVVTTMAFMIVNRPMNIIVPPASQVAEAAG
jgi:hypothetical protein